MSDPSDEARLSRLLFHAREIIDMYADIVYANTASKDNWATRTRYEIDTYRAEQGWSPHGYGGEG